MAYSRRLGVLSLVSACWFVAVACSDDEDRKPNAGDAGEGGDDGGGGKAGTPSVGGSQGGKAGMSGGGQSGSAGDAGSGTGGTGEAGSGSIVAGAGGEGGAGGSPVIGGGGEGGVESGGAGGEGGAEPAPVAKSCVWSCDGPSDCTRVDAPPGQCNDTSDVCEDPLQVCSADADCGPGISFWTLGCATSAECDLGYECVDYLGETYCAILDDPQAGGCFDYVSVPAVMHEGGAAVNVCVDPLARCDQGKCAPHCEKDGCAADEGDTCNPESGICECETSAECGNKACVNSRCTECAVDADCTAGAAITGHDKCVGGKCGCASADSCPVGDYPGATVACQ